MIRLCNELFSVDFNKMDSDHEKWWSVRLPTVLQSKNAKSDTNNKSCCQKRNTYLKLIIAKQSLSFISLYWEGILFSITLRGTEITLPPPRLWECDCVSIINPCPGGSALVCCLDVSASHDQPPGPGHDPPSTAGDRSGMRAWERSRDVVVGGCSSAVWQRGGGDQSAASHTAVTYQSGLVSLCEETNSLQTNKVGVVPPVHPSIISLL